MPFPSPGGLPDLGIKPKSPTFQADALPSEPPGKPVALIVNRKVQNALIGCNIKNNRMISIRFQGKPFSMTVIQVYAPTNNAEEAEIEQFYEDLQDLLELTYTHKKMSFSS